MKFTLFYSAAVALSVTVAAPVASANTFITIGTGGGNRRLLPSGGCDMPPGQ
jgi:hypothetical protein